MTKTLSICALVALVAGCATTQRPVQKPILSDTRQEVETGQTGVFLTGYANVGVSHEF